MWYNPTRSLATCCWPVEGSRSPRQTTTTSEGLPPSSRRGRSDRRRGSLTNPAAGRPAVGGVSEGQPRRILKYRILCEQVLRRRCGHQPELPLRSPGKPVELGSTQEATPLEWEWSVTTLGTGSRGVAGVDLFDRDARDLCLVRQEGVELGERPAGEPVPRVGAPGRNPVADARQGPRRPAAPAGPVGRGAAGREAGGPGRRR